MRHITIRRFKMIPLIDTGSLSGRLRIFYIVMVFILLVPVLVSIGVTTHYASQNAKLIQSAQDISTLVPIVRSDIYDELWQEVSGLTAMGDGKYYQLLDTINETLARTITAAPSAQNTTDLHVATRAMRTLTGYVDRLCAQMKTNAPVSDNEGLLYEVRGVSTLVVDLLQAYVISQIGEMTRMNNQLANTVWMTLLGEGLLLFVTLILGAKANRSLGQFVRRPIMRLENFAATIASGNLGKRADPPDLAELNGLTSSMNIMANKLQTLLLENAREQENLKKAELRTLQAQITPHFLYNTLDAIVWLAESQRTDEVIRITRALSSFYRISLSRGQDFISIRQEIEHIEGYLTIQQIRYRDLLSYHLSIDESLLDFPILKLLLQPLVENAIYHGIRNRRVMGMLTISAERSGSSISFTIQDNGLGMSGDRLSQIQQMLQGNSAPEEGDGQGYGLYNVHQRIRLYYEQSMGLTITSNEQQGTTVTFCVPLHPPAGGV